MKKLFYILLTILFILLVYSLVDIKKTIEIVSRGNIYFIILAVLIGIANTFFIGLKLKTIFLVFKNISTLYFIALGYFGSFISMLLPFSIGGFTMAIILSKKAKVSYLKSFSAILSDFLIGIAVTLFTSPFALIYFYNKKLISLGGFRQFQPYIPVAIIILSAGFAYFISKRKLIQKSFIFFLSSKVILTKAILLSFLIWFLSSFQFYVFFLAFGIQLSFVDFILANSILGALSLIPGAPGKIGQYETFGILTLPYLINVDKNEVFAVLLCMRMISSLIILILGYISIHFLSINLSKIFKK